MKLLQSILFFNKSLYIKLNLLSIGHTRRTMLRCVRVYICNVGKALMIMHEGNKIGER